MATVLAIGRFLGTLLLVFGIPFLLLVYVIGTVESVHPRNAWLDGYRNGGPPVGGQAVMLARFDGDLFESPDGPFFFPVDLATDGVRH